MSEKPNKAEQNRCILCGELTPPGILDKFDGFCEECYSELCPDDDVEDLW